jgi:hypothetical protein
MMKGYRYSVTFCLYVYIHFTILHTMRLPLNSMNCSFLPRYLVSNIYLVSKYIDHPLSPRLVSHFKELMHEIYSTWI